MAFWGTLKVHCVMMLIITIFAFSVRDFMVFINVTHIHITYIGHLIYFFKKRKFPINVMKVQSLVNVCYSLGIWKIFPSHQNGCHNPEFTIVQPCNIGSQLVNPATLPNFRTLNRLVRNKMGLFFWSLTCVLCNRHHIFFMAFFPILLSRKQKRCVLGQKSKFEKKIFFRRLWAATAGLQYWQNPKIRHVFWAQITSKYSQYGIFSEQLKALGMLNLPDFQFDAQEAKWQLTLALGAYRGQV